MITRILTLVLFMSSLVFLSCNQEGIGGKASISGVVQHHEIAIPGAIVYIMYGADEFPGFDYDEYDDNVIVNADASFTFDKLNKGSYYLHAIGYDSLIMENVGGGVAIEIKKKKEHIETEVSVTD